MSAGAKWDVIGRCSGERPGSVRRERMSTRNSGVNRWFLCRGFVQLLRGLNCSILGNLTGIK